jgi:hypothetical protein
VPAMPFDALGAPRLLLIRCVYAALTVGCADARAGCVGQAGQGWLVHVRARHAACVHRSLGFLLDCAAALSTAKRARLSVAQSMFRMKQSGSSQTRACGCSRRPLDCSPSVRSAAHRFAVALPDRFDSRGPPSDGCIISLSPAPHLSLTSGNFGCSFV